MSVGEATKTNDQLHIPVVGLNEMWRKHLLESEVRIIIMTTVWIVMMVVVTVLGFGANFLCFGVFFNIFNFYISADI